MSFQPACGLHVPFPAGLSGAIRRDHSSRYGSIGIRLGWRRLRTRRFAPWRQWSRQMARQSFLNPSAQTCSWTLIWRAAALSTLFSRAWGFPPPSNPSSPGVTRKVTGSLSRPAATACGLFFSHRRLHAFDSRHRPNDKAADRGAMGAHRLRPLLPGRCGRGDGTHAGSMACLTHQI